MYENEETHLLLTVTTGITARQIRKIEILLFIRTLLFIFRCLSFSLLIFVFFLFFFPFLLLFLLPLFILCFLFLKRTGITVDKCKKTQNGCESHRILPAAYYSNITQEQTVEPHCTELQHSQLPDHILRYVYTVTITHEYTCISQILLYKTYYISITCYYISIIPQPDIDMSIIKNE